MRLILFLFTAVLSFGFAKCASISKLHKGKQSAHVLDKKIVKGLRIQYLLYLPDDYGRHNKKFPLMLFLHGSGERGKNLEKVKVHGPPKLLEQGEKFPFIIVSPQCPKNENWQTDVLDQLLSEICKHYRVDENRIYVTGLSMGGFGTWELAIKYPHRFAAIAPVCGGGYTFMAEQIKHLPVWVFHGAKDKAVPLSKSQEMVDALNAVGGNVKFTIYPEAGHDSWTETYDNPELYDWLLQHSR